MIAILFSIAIAAPLGPGPFDDPSCRTISNVFGHACCDTCASGFVLDQSKIITSTAAAKHTVSEFVGYNALRVVAEPPGDAVPEGSGLIDHDEIESMATVTLSDVVETVLAEYTAVCGACVLPAACIESHMRVNTWHKTCQ